jgi:hypothetical protein
MSLNVVEIFSIFLKKYFLNILILLDYYIFYLLSELDLTHPSEPDSVGLG